MAKQTAHPVVTWTCYSVTHPKFKLAVLVSFRPELAGYKVVVWELGKKGTIEFYFEGTPTEGEAINHVNKYHDRRRQQRKGELFA